MERELLLLRHGKSDWGVEVDDYHRPLQKRGKRGAKKMGAWMLQQQWLPDRVISSPAERAITTAERTCQAMGLDKKLVEVDFRIYEADTSDLLDLARSCPNSIQRLMLVGHNPDMEMLVLSLSETKIPIPSDGKLMPTATLARLSFEGDWSSLTSGKAKLLSITRPADLP